MAAAIKVIVSVDWEGRSLEANDLNAMKIFREKHPHIPHQHFLNAAYFTKSDADHDLVVRNVQSVLLPGDEHGLHIHPWQSLLAASGVKPQRQPSLFNGETPLKVYGSDWGHEVCLDFMSQNELRAVIRKSVELLVNAGFRRPKSFRAGAWIAPEKVLASLSAEGIIHDCSSTWIKPLKNRWQEYHLYEKLSVLWKDITSVSQPYHISISGLPDIFEVPNNGSLADYVTSEDMVEVFAKNLGLLLEYPDGSDRIVSVGYHQETASKYLHRIENAITEFEALAQQANVSLDYVTL